MAEAGPIIIPRRVQARTDMLAWGEAIPGHEVMPIYHASGDLWFVFGLDKAAPGQFLVEAEQPPQRQSTRAEQIAEWHKAADDDATRAVCYFIGAPTGPVKIGFSTDVKTRLNALQSSSPVKLQILATAPGGYLREGAYHFQFEKHRLHGEWFKRSAGIKAEIARLNCEIAA